MEIEACMVPGAAKRIIYEEPVAQRGAIMGAKGTNGEKSPLLPNKKYLFAGYVPEQHSSIRNRREVNSLGEVGSLKFHFSALTSE
jgi:hypothetical protein